MKICLAQSDQSVENIRVLFDQHVTLIRKASKNKPDLILFPELSLTGYEPSLARELAVEYDDNMFDPIQRLSNDLNSTIGIGMPLKASRGITISTVFLRPGKSRVCNHKTFLHEDEEPFFVPGECLKTIEISDKKVGLSICYELSVPAHQQMVMDENPDIYLASTAKTEKGVNEASGILSELAKQHQIPVGMVNCLGESEDGFCAGKSAFWNQKGKITSQLDNSKSGILEIEI